MDKNSDIMSFTNYSDLYGSLYDVSKKICKTIGEFVLVNKRQPKEMLIKISLI